MTLNPNGILRQPGSGSSCWVIDSHYTFKAVSEDTGGAYALIELLLPPQSGAPAHIHSQEDEAFYIQEGEVEFQLDQQTIVATIGTFLHSPKGQPHGFKNIGTTPAKMLCLLTPAGLEKFFMEVGKPTENWSFDPPSVSPEDIEKLMATAPMYGLEIIPPSPAEME
ncbi:MAG: cupin domain-containing protein [Coleofasciculus sp. S288]|nr:cupin domain-containing protein [Coleofasciculus sp. S288]